MEHDNDHWEWREPKTVTWQILTNEWMKGKAKK